MGMPRPNAACHTARRSCRPAIGTPSAPGFAKGPRITEGRFFPLSLRACIPARLPLSADRPEFIVRAVDAAVEFGYPQGDVVDHIPRRTFETGLGIGRPSRQLH